MAVTVWWTGYQTYPEDFTPTLTKFCSLKWQTQTQSQSSVRFSCVQHLARTGNPSTRHLRLTLAHKKKRGKMHAATPVKSKTINFPFISNLAGCHKALLVSIIIHCWWFTNEHEGVPVLLEPSSLAIRQPPPSWLSGDANFKETS